MRCITLQAGHPQCGGHKEGCGSALGLALGSGGPEVCNEQPHSLQNFPMPLVGLFNGRTSGRCVCREGKKGD